MAGTFLNTKMSDAIKSVTDGVVNRISNSSYYKWLDKHPTITTFYNPNKKYSTLDEATKQAYSTKGVDAPFRFDKINNCLLYGLAHINVDLNVGEFGLETSEISGECVIPPNTFKPSNGAFFTINHIKGPYIFLVNKVSYDTIENGANFWVMNYNLEGTGYDFLNDIESRVVKTWNMYADNIGTDNKVLITAEDTEWVSKLEAAAKMLKDYYMAVFFKNSLQTFVYQYHDDWFYDPETIEFIIRNDLLSGGSEYIYVDQAIYLPRTFALDYDKCLYKNVEDCNPKINLRRYYGLVNCDPMSLLDTRLEEYYIVTPRLHFGLLGEILEIYDAELIGAIMRNEKQTGAKQVYNIIANYFNDKKDMCECMLDWLKDIEYCNNAILYHLIPILIFILNAEISKLLKASTDTSDKEHYIFD